MIQINDFEERAKAERNRYEKSPPIYMQNRYENIEVKASLAKLDPLWQNKSGIPSPRKSPQSSAR
jgi:hypothetical protein